MPSGTRFEVVADSRDILGESPTWSETTGCLYWVDLRRPCLHRLHVASGRKATWPMPEVIGAVVSRQSGGVVIALKDGLHAFDPDRSDLVPLVQLEFDRPHNRLNDAKCDAAGRIWCGSMWDYGLHPTGGLYRVDGDLSVTGIRSDVCVANAISFSPDDRTMYFADSRKGQIEQAAFDVRTGDVGPWSVLVDADAVPGVPDGATVDAEGFIWNARYKGGCLARFAPDGRLDRLIELPVSQPTSCAFGGPGLRTLFVTTATQKLSESELESQPLAGSLLALDAGVAGRLEPAFAG